MPAMGAGLQAASASMLPGLLGFLDRRLMVPAVAAIGVAGGRGGGLGNGLGCFIAASAESLPAPGRELVDPGGSLIQTRRHRHLLEVDCAVRRNPWFRSFGLMVRPNRSRVVTKTDIVGAPSGCNLTAGKSLAVYFDRTGRTAGRLLQNQAKFPADPHDSAGDVGRPPRSFAAPSVVFLMIRRPP